MPKARKWSEFTCTKCNKYKKWGIQNKDGWCGTCDAKTKQKLHLQYVKAKVVIPTKKRTCLMCDASFDSSGNRVCQLCHSTYDFSMTDSSFSSFIHAS